MTEFKSSNFLIPISSENRRLKELKFNMYIKSSTTNHSGKWDVNIVNSTGEKTYLNGTNINTTNDRVTLFGIVEGLKQLLNQYSILDQKHLKINCFTDNIYCSNVIKEWINIWKKEGFVNRPNSDLLTYCNTMINHCNFNINYIPLVNEI